MLVVLFQLVYFNFRGRAEFIRYILIANGVPFKDERIELDDWPQVKSKHPTFRLPYLEITMKNGTTVLYEESLAIGHQIAMHHHMIPNNPEGLYRMEKMIFQCLELENEFWQVKEAPKEEEERLIQRFREDAAPKFLAMICKSLTEAGGQFAAGTHPTLADFYLLSVMEHVSDVDPNILNSGYPNIAKHRKVVLEAYPKLAAYIKSRAVTPY
ncbi:unnamed protein product [Calicophoron daubneyi]|uniref:Glutathione transferase n=1 Tax=Calicophoron daubneyi TaxID=300641 RepID=A0AAV2TBW9_CALDB